MEKIRCICIMRDLVRAMSELESSLEENYGISLNEAMAMCAIGEETVTAGTVVNRTGLKAPHVSKVLRSIEGKGLVTRNFGDCDKRQICFSLTGKAKDCLSRLRSEGIAVPDLIRSIFAEDRSDTI